LPPAARLAFLHLLFTEGGNLEKRQGLVCLLVGGDILDDGCCLAILSDDHGLAAGQTANNFRGGALR
jgi:hypothetical protein